MAAHVGLDAILGFAVPLLAMTETKFERTGGTYHG
jgi:hypothetical protein